MNSIFENLKITEQFNKPFTKKDVLKKFPDESEEDVEDILNYHFPFAKNKYYLNSLFMKKFTLRIIPNEFEIKNGIIIPGHRMIGFTQNMEIFDDFKFSYKNKILKSQEIEGLYEDLLLFISLLDLEVSPIVDSTKTTITLNGINLEEFYDDTNFKIGDSILVSYSDCIKSKLEIKYESKVERDSNFFMTQYQDNLFLEKLKKIVKEKWPTTNAICQICTAYLQYYLDKKSDLSIPLTTIGKLIISKESSIYFKKIEMGRVILYNVNYDFDEDNYLPSEDYMLSQLEEDRNLSLSDVKNIEDFFRYYGLSISIIELRALIFDQLSEKEVNINKLISTIFDGREKPDRDEEKLLKKFLLKELKAIEKQNEYNYTSLPIVLFRKRLIESTLKVTTFLRELDSYQITLEDLPMNEMRELASIQLMISNNLFIIETIDKKEDLSKLTEPSKEIFKVVNEMISILRTTLLEGKKKSNLNLLDNSHSQDNSIFQFKVALCNYDLTFRGNPYRIFEIPADRSLEDLGATIISLFGFDNDHLFGFYDFKKNRANSSEKYELQEDDSTNVSNIDINNVFYLKKKMQFIYDFGENWKFMIRLEKIRDMNSKELELYDKYSYKEIKTEGESPKQYSD